MLYSLFGDGLYVNGFGELLVALLAGLLIAAFSVLPYLLLLLAADRTGSGAGAFLAAIPIAILDVAMRAQVLLFPGSSTDGVAWVLMPLPLALYAGVVWGAMELRSRRDS